jgi:abequosyltransferase
VLANHATDFSSLVGTLFVQLGWAYTALNGFVRGLYIREKLIGVRANNTGSYKLLQTFGPGLATITEKWLKSGSVGRIIINGTIQRFWPLMLLRYKNSSQDFGKEADPEAILTPVYKDNFRYWVFAYPIIVLPYPLAAIWAFAVRIVNRLDKAAGYPMLSSRQGAPRS